MAPRETRLENGTFQRLGTAQSERLAQSLQTRPAYQPPTAVKKPAPAKAPASPGAKKPAAETKDWPLELSAKLFYKRSWGHNSGKTARPENVYLRGARVELRIVKAGAAVAVVHATAHVEQDGRIIFTGVPACSLASLRIHLEHQGLAVTIKGRSDAVNEPDYGVKKDAVVWHDLPLDLARVPGCRGRLDLGALQVKHERFAHLCDAYRSIVHAHQRILDLSGTRLPVCVVHFPEPVDSTSCVSAGEMYLLEADLRDRDVICHEYGHFVHDKVLGGIENPGYDYGDDDSGAHNAKSKEHYEAAWNEGYGTFISCAISGDPVYHDGYDTDLFMYLEHERITVGPHCEGSIQGALWSIYQGHGLPFASMWKAMMSQAHRKVRTVFDFYDNWKDLKLAHLDKVVEAFESFGMGCGYRYLAGEDRFTFLALAKAPDRTVKMFAAVEALWEAFGQPSGGTKAEYFEEFYNRNRTFNKGTLAAGATAADPKVTAGMKYIVPVRFKVSA